ncbi:MAG: L,D-transpeptidase [Kiritimatiellae bacterium]|nr:L,D-transpeptidase [Kiritimatiellia bacterium]
MSVMFSASLVCAVALAAVALSGCAGKSSAAVPASGGAEAPEPPAAETGSVFDEAMRRGLPRGGLLIVADTATGVASLHSRRGELLRMPFSWASAGIGAEAGSNKTPPGWHRVAERFGDGAPRGAFFVSRRHTGRVIPPSGWNAPDPAEDAVLTRIMWLDGLEPGVNKGGAVDSHARYIYLHGTNQEHKLGGPASHGCLRFSNADIERLFELARDVEVFCLVK